MMRCAIAGDSVSGRNGRYGAKLQAADVACRAGIDTIAAGSRPGVIGDVMEGLSVGTLPRAGIPTGKPQTLDFWCASCR
jgi:glutamate 5-kinase